MNKIGYIISFIILAIIISAGVFALKLKQNNQLAVTDCVITGCSSEICSDQEIGSYCIYKPEFACYKNAICARQADGQCGWTVTEELDNCLKQNSKCQEQDNACCNKFGCNLMNTTCAEGQTPEFQGCDEDCQPIIECIKIK